MSKGLLHAQSAKTARFTKILNALILTSLISACSENPAEDSDNAAFHTGNSIFEIQTNDNAQASDLSVGKKQYVFGSRLRLRSTPVVVEDNIVGVLAINDEVEVADDKLEGDFVKIKVVSTHADIDESAYYFVSYKFLGDKMAVEKRLDSQSPYFMIQNIATEKIRIYKKNCDSGDCSHKLVLETDMVAGEKTNNKSTMTVTGSFHITSWHKFYQDGGGLYPSWYDPNYPSLPGPGASLTSWLSKDLLPYSGASLRGAFGWYTAKVGPNSHFQWTHGTFGWGKDKSKFIEATRGFWANLFADPRSHGCSRTDNESIAYVREMLPVGTPIIKIYAKEAYADKNRTSYSDKKERWNYILTKNGVRQDGQLSGRDTVVNDGTSKSKWLEEGAYKVDAYPDAKRFRGGSFGATSGDNGNVYGLDDKNMRGVFLVDEGRVVNYSHPSKVGRGGYNDQLYPTYIVADSNTQYTIPEPARNDYGSDSDCDHEEGNCWP